MPGFRSWLTPTSSVILGKLLNLSAPQFLIRSVINRYDTSTYISFSERSLTAEQQYKIMARAGALTPAS